MSNEVEFIESKSEQENKLSWGAKLTLAYVASCIGPEHIDDDAHTAHVEELVKAGFVADLETRKVTEVGMVEAARLYKDIRENCLSLTEAHAIAMLLHEPQGEISIEPVGFGRYRVHVLDQCLIKNMREAIEFLVEFYGFDEDEGVETL